MAGANAEPFWGRTDDAAFLQLQWDLSWTIVKSNDSGKTGWARVIRSCGGDVLGGACRRFHKCVHNPCTSRWTASKYGVYGPPIHVQEVAEKDVPLGPATPTSASLHANYIPPPHPCDPWTSDPAVAEKSKEVGVDAPMSGKEKTFQVVLTLARQMSTPRAYVGYIFFVLVGLVRQCRPLMWEGSNQIDLLEMYAPWACGSCTADCAVQGVTCCPRALPSGIVQMLPISEEVPLHDCRHFIACHALEHGLECAGDSIDSFYGRLGLVLLGTVMDGDCGPDVACMMLGIAQTRENRTSLRKEVSDYLLERHACPWIHQLLVVCQELDVEVFENSKMIIVDADVVDLERPPTADVITTGVEISAVADKASAQADEVIATGVESSAVADKASAVADKQSAVADLATESHLELLEALKWSTGLKEMDMLCDIASGLPIWSRTEQILAFRNREIVAQKLVAQEQVSICPTLWKDRVKVARLYEEYLRSCGVIEGERAPRNALTKFVSQKIKWQFAVKNPQRCVMRWHNNWLKDGKPHHRANHNMKPICYKGVTNLHRRRATGHQGAPLRCNWVRESLFDWFISMRYAIDWKTYNAALRSCGRYKAMGRFPAALVKKQAKIFLSQYMKERLLAGLASQAMVIDNRWLKRWMHEYGLSLRAPNRKFKVPKNLLAERLRIWWLNLARVRALCIELHGYDPVQENWDQSPFHLNEIGSQDAKTLVVKGSHTVPLIEGHSDVRARWTANLTTFSDHERIRSGGIPYAEFMFKADGDKVLKRLQEHIRSRGYGSWVSVATGPKGSYRQEHILEFLEKHLPVKTQSRRWRIALGDDFSAHKTENVGRLCWQRGYVMMLHPGGATPITQTVDTDLNQHVKREYSVLESLAILDHMRKGMAVPKLAPTECVDMMVQVLSDPQIHLRAADGYKKTGATVALDGSEDHLIVREAGEFFRELGMRELINREVSIVRNEAKAGRLRWTHHDINTLIQAYPQRKDIDDVLEAIAEHQHLDDDEKPYHEDHEDAAVAESSECAEEESAVAADAEAESAVADGEEAESAVADGAADLGAEQQTDVSPNLTPAAADRLQESQALVAAYDSAIEVLMSSGAVNAAIHIQDERRKELKRQRVAATEDSAVADALLAISSARAAEERRERLALQTLNQREAELARIRKTTAETSEVLRKRKQDILALENILAARKAFKRYAPESLGQGKSRSGGVAARKLRFEVLDRMVNLGSGLSAPQSNDWAWFREAWDSKMSAEHADDWGGFFSGWMQKVLDDMTNGVSNAFSEFVHAETVRNFKDVPMLVLPATEDA